MNTKIDSVETFLKEIFPASEIAHASIDFNHNFRVTTDSEIYLLRIGQAFMSDNTPDQLVKNLKDWQISKELISHGEMGVLVTLEGVSLFKRN